MTSNNITSSSMQLMPYASPVNQPGISSPIPNPFYAQQTSTPTSNSAKIPLTPEQLTKLYSMGPYGVSPRLPVNQFPPAYGFTATTSPIAPHLHTQHSIAFNQQFHPVNSVGAFAQQTQLYNQSTGSISSTTTALSENFTTYAQNSNASLQQQSPVARPTFDNVTNPESALVHVPKVGILSTNETPRHPFKCSFMLFRCYSCLPDRTAWTALSIK